MQIVNYLNITFVESLTARIPDLQTNQRLSLISIDSGSLDSGGTGPIIRRYYFNNKDYVYITFALVLMCNKILNVINLFFIGLNF